MRLNYLRNDEIVQRPVLEARESRKPIVLVKTFTVVEKRLRSTPRCALSHSQSQQSFFQTMVGIHFSFNRYILQSHEEMTS